MEVKFLNIRFNTTISFKFVIRIRLSCSTESSFGLSKKTVKFTAFWQNNNFRDQNNTQICTLSKFVATLVADKIQSYYATPECIYLRPRSKIIVPVKLFVQKTGSENILEPEPDLSLIVKYNIFVSCVLLSDDNMVQIINPNTNKVILPKKTFLSMAEHAAILPYQEYSTGEEKDLYTEEIKVFQDDRRLFNPCKIKIGYDTRQDLRDEILKLCYKHADASMWNDNRIGRIKNYKHCILFKQ